VLRLQLQLLEFIDGAMPLTNLEHTFQTKGFARALPGINRERDPTLA
jgi:hypothetical protein